MINQHLLHLILVVQIVHIHTFLYDEESIFDDPNWVNKTKSKLLANYDKHVRPGNHDNYTEVSMNMVFIHLDLDDKTSILTVNGIMILDWIDEKLHWDPMQYGNLTKIHWADSEIWKPDILLYNNALGNNIEHYGKTHSVGFPSGKILSYPPATFKSYCILDWTDWPFDSQTCTLRFGSWFYTGSEIKLKTNESEPANTFFHSKWSSEWNLIKIIKTRNAIQYACCPDLYYDITFTVSLVRKTNLYHVLLVVPAFVLTSILLTALWLPLRSTPRVILTTFTTLALTFFIVYLGERLPDGIDTTPVLVKYYSRTLVLSSLAFVFTIALTNISSLVNETPELIEIYLLDPRLLRVLGLSELSQVSLNHEMINEEIVQGNENESILPTDEANSWNLIALIADRLFFVLYLLLFLIITLEFA